MKTSNEKPPIWDELVKAFGVEWGDVLVAYDDTIYTGADSITPDLVAHESKHLDQQAEFGVEYWWQKYIMDEDFRISQEVEAYGVQYRYWKTFEKNRELVSRALHFMAEDLSSEQYGKAITYSEALRRIKNGRD